VPPDASPRASRRLSWLAIGVLVWGAIIFGKLVLLQIVRHDRYLAVARQQQERLVEIPAPRGSIFDRSDHPLAMSVTMDSVSVNPRLVPDLQVAAGILSGILNLDRDALYGRLKYYSDMGKGFMWVKRKISPEESRSLRRLRLEWIDFHSESQRHYPNLQLAANLLGSVDHEEQGNSGIEAALNEDLAGHPGTERLLTDVKRRGIDSQLDTEAHAGSSITLTIDDRIQYVAEQAIGEAVRKHNAKTGSVVVMNPHNGEVYAMASYPTFDPNKAPTRSEEPGARFNNAISVPFEPGSVFKIITVAAALETTNLRPETIINCGGGALTLFGRTIHEAKHGYGSIPMSDVLARSSNIGAILVGLRVGQERMHDYVRRFGFGQRTGITLPAESPGIVRKLKVWGATSLASVAMGHEISTTTLQLAQACSVVANGGLLVRPRIVLKKDGQPYPAPPPQRVIRAETAITMRKMMEGVVVLPYGTGHRFARLDGYSSGGKTGSAQIYDFANRRYTHTYNGSFIGFAPVPNPAIVVVVTVNGTHGTAGFGGVAAAPVFKTVAQEALRVLDVPKDLPDAPPPEEKKKAPEKEEINDLSIAELANPEEAGEKPEVAVAPPPRVNGPTVPNFKGMTLRAVLAEASSRGIQLQVDGSGIAQLQQPAAGSPLRHGEPILVRFAK